jgi:hypothetical protein
MSEQITPYDVPVEHGAVVVPGLSTCVHHRPVTVHCQACAKLVPDAAAGHVRLYVSDGLVLDDPDVACCIHDAVGSCKWCAELIKELSDWWVRAGDATVAAVPRDVLSPKQPSGRPAGDNVVHPSHYNWLPGVECWQVAEHFNFNMGNVLKYVWRAGFRDHTLIGTLEDLEKAREYLGREIDRISGLVQAQQAVIRRGGYVLPFAGSATCVHGAPVDHAVHRCTACAADRDNHAARGGARP